MELKQLNFGLVKIDDFEYPKEGLHWQWDMENGLVTIFYNNELLAEQVSYDIFTLDDVGFDTVTELKAYVVKMYGPIPNVAGGVYRSSTLISHTGDGSLYTQLEDNTCNAVQLSVYDKAIYWRRDDQDLPGFMVRQNVCVIGGINNSNEIWIRNVNQGDELKIVLEAIIF